MTKKLLCSFFCLLLFCGCKPSSANGDKDVKLSVSVCDKYASLVNEENGFEIYQDLQSVNADVVVAPLLGGFDALNDDYQILAVFGEGDEYFISKREDLYSGVCGYYWSNYDHTLMFDTLKTELQSYSLEDAGTYEELIDGFENGHYLTIVLDVDTAENYLNDYLERTGQELFVTAHLKEMYERGADYSSFPSVAVFVRKGVADSSTNALLKLSSDLKAAIGSEYETTSNCIDEVEYYLDLTGRECSDNRFVR